MPKKIKAQYEPVDDMEKIGYLIEECGEVLAAAGKSIRWGLDGFNPELPENDRVRNGDWLMDELHDLKRAISYVEEILYAEGYSGTPDLFRDITERKDKL